MATQSAAEKWADAIGLNEKNLVRFQAIAAFNAGLEHAAKLAIDTAPANYAAQKITRAIRKEISP